MSIDEEERVLGSIADYCLNEEYRLGKQLVQDFKCQWCYIGKSWVNVNIVSKLKPLWKKDKLPTLEKLVSEIGYEPRMVPQITWIPPFGHLRTLRGLIDPKLALNGHGMFIHAFWF